MTFQEQITILELLTLKKVVNYFKVVLSYIFSVFLKRVVLWGYPFGVSVEVSGWCNLRCPHCPTGMRTLTRKKKDVDFLDYKKIVDELNRYIIVLNLYFQGEPFLNSELFKIIKYAREKKIYTITSTNGHFLTQKSVDAIFESGLNKIIISLDGFSKETYESYRIGGDFNRVLNGIKLLVNEKRRRKSVFPFISVQFVVFSFNEHEIALGRKFKKETHVDEILFKTAQIYDYSNNKNLIPQEIKYSRYKIISADEVVMKHKIKNRCFRVWHTLVSTGEGEIVPCCFDKDAQFIFGSIKHQSVRQIWFSSEFNTYRKKVLENRKKFEICLNCTE